MNNSILVYGWYNKGNIGDELFKEAFTSLFPEYSFIFTDKIHVATLKDVAAVFIGGGSFLFAPPNMEKGALEILKQKKLFYIGVGVETDIHPVHVELMQTAQMVVTRSFDQLDKIKKINNNAVFAPDIVYSVQKNIWNSPKLDKTILVVPNMAVVPSWSDPHWKHAAWHYFKSEFAQFLDELADQKYRIDFFSMCNNPDTDDKWAAYEIISSMKNRRNTQVLEDTKPDMYSTSLVWSQYQTVITQRFHGIVISEMLKIPYLSLYHHDKLKSAYPGNGPVLSYYGLTKRQLFEQFIIANKFNSSSLLPIESNIFKELQQTIVSLIKGG